MESWEGVPVLVTGGGGFIGGHLTVALARAGARVKALCRYNSRGSRGTLDWFEPAAVAAIEVVHGDLRDIDSVGSAMDGTEVAFHLGAQIAIPYSLTNPRDAFATNLGGSLNVAQAAVGAGLRRLVHVSTSEVYGDAATLPIDEGHPLAPRSPYAAAKASADLLMQSFQRSYGLGVVTARPFNTYGPHQSARAVIPAIAIQALAGSTLALGRLDPRRDLTFVDDTVAGLMAIGAGPDALVGQTLQLGSGRDVTIGELVELIGEILDRELTVTLDPDRVRPAGSEVPRLLSDHALASRLTGWQPRVGLRAGLTRTLDWFAANLHRYRPAEYAR